MGRTKGNQRDAGVKLDPFELIIYRLSPILGGRSEVLETPVIEALNYLTFEKESREAERMEKFQMAYFGGNSKVDAKARKKFYDSIKPSSSGGKVLNNPGKQMDWDYSNLDEFRAKPKE